MAEVTFDFAEKSRKLEEIKSKALSIMEQNDQYKSVIENIEHDLNEKGKDDKLLITFVGQYNAGKSTIISVLTGNDNIKIDSNIATDTIKKYPWRDVLLVDTPGLYTHHPEHDAITEEAIKQADIVVYCLTYSLFDNLLLNDFNKLAYERAYSEKMFLVINKMDGEYGKYNELVSNYKRSLIKNFGEDGLKIPLSFIVAQWQRDNDPEVRKESHFDDFILSLNDFIEKNGQMGKLLGPVNIFIDNIQQGIIENNEKENRDFFLIIDRIDRNLKKQERECDSFFLSLIDELHSKIVNLGYRFANMTPEGQVEAEDYAHKIESEMEQYCNQALLNLESKFSEVQDELNTALLEIAESELVQNYYASNAPAAVGGKVVSFENSKNDNKANIDFLNQMFTRVKAGSDAVIIAAGGGSGLLKATQASGSVIHKGVLSVGHFFGASFKPWQAVNIAKNIGNIAKFLVPFLMALQVGLEVKSAIDEEKRVEEEKRKKRELISYFSEQANSVEKQFKEQYKNYKEQVIYGKQNFIKNMRDQKTKEINLTDKTAKELKICIDEFKEIIGSIKSYR